jgi:hypothetical protein
LQVGQLAPSELKRAVHIRKFPVPSRQVVRLLGQLLQNLRPLLLEVLDLGCDLVTVARQGRKGLLAPASPEGHVLQLPACCRKLLLQSCLCLASLLNALLGLGDIGGLRCSLPRNARKTLAGLGLLLPGCFEPASDFGQLLGAFDLGVRNGCDFIERRDATLFDILSFGSRLGQLLHVHLDLLRDLRLLLALVLKLCLNRGMLCLSLIARLCRFAQSRTGGNDLGLQVGD